MNNFKTVLIIIYSENNAQVKLLSFVAYQFEIFPKTYKIKTFVVTNAMLSSEAGVCAIYFITIQIQYNDPSLQKLVDRYALFPRSLTAILVMQRL